MASGRCFRNVNLAAELDDRVIHGWIVNLQGENLRHAWIERGGMVFDPTTGAELEEGHWYELVTAKPESIYTGEQAKINTIRSGNSGPWLLSEVGDRFLWRKDAKRENPRRRRRRR